MSRTDKTDPHRVKVSRYGEHYWMSIHFCPCRACRGIWLVQEHCKARTERRAAVREWQRDYA